LGGTTLDTYIVEMDSGSSVSPDQYRIMQIQANTVTDTFYTLTYLNSLGTYVNLQAGDIYKFRITARNIVGDSVNSATVAVMAATLPGAPGQPTRKESSETSVAIAWTAPTDDGGTPITDYQVLWDSGLGGAFVSLGSSINSLEFTPSYTLVTGYTYKFKVRAINYIGTGPESNSVSVIAASTPDTPPKPYLLQAS
jgi:titin